MKINKLIQKIQSGDSMAANQLLIKMSPLIKKYAAKTFALEYDDAYQELSLALIKAVTHISDTSNENACLSYLKKTIVHQKSALLKKQRDISQMEISWNEQLTSNFIVKSKIEDTIFSVDFTNFLSQLPKKEQEILILLYYYDATDSEIAKKLNVSRQYINRIKKKIIQKANFI